MVTDWSTPLPNPQGARCVLLLSLQGTATFVNGAFHPLQTELAEAPWVVQKGLRRLETLFEHHTGSSWDQERSSQAAQGLRTHCTSGAPAVWLAACWVRWQPSWAARACWCPTTRPVPMSCPGIQP